MRAATVRSAGIATSMLLLGTLVLAGCSSTAPETAPPTAQERLAGSLTELFEQQLQNPNLSDFERDVFERAIDSGEIPQSDYDEGFNRYEQCVSDLGYEDTWTKQPNGVYRITPPPLKGQEAVDEYMSQTAECADGTTMRIEAMFIQQQSNPDLNADQRVVAIQCLLEAGFVDASYTTEDFDADLESGFQDATFDVASTEANTCLYNAGYAIAVQ